MKQLPLYNSTAINAVAAFIQWIDDRSWTIARRDDADDLVPVGLTMRQYALAFWHDQGAPVSDPSREGERT